MSEEVETKKKHLAAIDAFVASPAYEGYLAARRLELKDNAEAQVAIVPDSLSDLVELIQLKGERRYIEATLTMFEDARVSLERRIDEMVEAELQNANERKV